MTFAFWGFLIPLFYGLGNTALKPYIEFTHKDTTTTQALLWRQPVNVGALLLGAIVLGSDFSPLGNIMTVIKLCALSVGFYCASWLYFQAQGSVAAKVGVITTITNSSMFVLALMGIVVYGEYMSPLKGAALIVVAVGFVFITLATLGDSDHSNNAPPLRNLFETGVPQAFGVMILFVLLFGSIPYFFSGIEVIPMLIVFESGLLVCSFIHLQITRTPLRPPRGRFIPRLILSGVCNSVAIVIYMWGLNNDFMSYVSPMNALTPGFTAICALAINHTRMTRMQWLAVWVTMTGVVLLTLA